MPNRPHTTESINSILAVKFEGHFVLAGAYQANVGYNQIRCTRCQRAQTKNVFDVLYARNVLIRCPTCDTHPRALTTEKAQERLLEVHGGQLWLIEDYQSGDRLNRFGCECGHEWSATFKDVVGPRRTGCPRCCSHPHVAYTPREYRQRLRERQPTLRNVTPYTNAQTKLTFECVNGHRFENDPRAVFKLKGCPWCPRRTNHLSDEAKRFWAQGRNSRIALAFVDKVCEVTRLRFRTALHTLGEHKLYGTRFSLDGYNPSYRIAIEFHGSYYHREHDKQSEKYRNTLKRDRAIRRHPDVGLLIVVWESEWLRQPERTLARVVAEINTYKKS